MASRLSHELIRINVLRSCLSQGVLKLDQFPGKALELWDELHTETHTACKRPSPVSNGLKSESVYTRRRKCENRKDARLRQNERRKATRL